MDISTLSRRLERSVVLAVVLFAATAGILAVAAGLDEVRASLRAIDTPLVLALLGLSLVNYGLRVLRWHISAKRLGLPVPLLRTGLYYLAGFALTTTPGKIGEALRLWFLERYHGQRYASTLPLLIGDRVFDATAMLVLCSAAGLATAYTAHLWPLGAMLALLLAVTALLARTGPALAAVTAAYALIGRRAPRLFAGARRALRRGSRLFESGIYALSLLLSVAGWLAEGVAFFYLLDGLGCDLAPVQALFIFSFSMIVGASSMLPGGLGGTEATMIALLTAAAGVPLQTALVATCVIRVTTLWFAVALGLIAFPCAMRIRPAVPRHLAAEGMP